MMRNAQESRAIETELCFVLLFVAFLALAFSFA